LIFLVGDTKGFEGKPPGIAVQDVALLIAKDGVLLALAVDALLEDVELALVLLIEAK